jgi:hypothetical protein
MRAFQCHVRRDLAKLTVDPVAHLIKQTALTSTETNFLYIVLQRHLMIASQSLANCALLSCVDFQTNSQFQPPAQCDLTEVKAQSR